MSALLIAALFLSTVPSHGSARHVTLSKPVRSQREIQFKRSAPIGGLVPIAVAPVNDTTGGTSFNYGNEMHWVVTAQYDTNPNNPNDRAIDVYLPSVGYSTPPSPNPEVVPNVAGGYNTTKYTIGTYGSLMASANNLNVWVTKSIAVGDSDFAFHKPNVFIKSISFRHPKKHGDTVRCTVRLNKLPSSGEVLFQIVPVSTGAFSGLNTTVVKKNSVKFEVYVTVTGNKKQHGEIGLLFYLPSYNYQEPVKIKLPN
ncbi:MAG: hypothetical protein ACAH95_05755 [Fimbriimonas sp.]